MESVFPHPRMVLLRLLVVAAIAVGHCCLMGQNAWAADAHGGGSSAHGVPGQAMPAHWGSPAAPMVCDGAHAVVAARLALPAPTPVAALMAARQALGAGVTGPARPARAYRNPPDPHPPSRAVLQIFLI